MGVCVQRGALDRNVHLHDLEHWGVGVLVAAIGPRVVSRGICGLGGLEGVGGRVLCLFVFYFILFQSDHVASPEASRQ